MDTKTPPDIHAGGPPHALPPLPAGVVWHVTVAHLGVKIRPDGQQLTATIGWDLLRQEYDVVCLESWRDATLDQVLDGMTGHAHRSLGSFATEAEAKEEVERFAVRWMQSEPAAQCDCAPIPMVRGEDSLPIGAEGLALMFHETYERLAPQFAYQTREATAVPWADVPENNRQLMIAVAADVLGRLGAASEPKTQGAITESNPQ